MTIGQHQESNPSDAASQAALLDGGAVDMVDARNPFIPSNGSVPIDNTDPGGGTPDNAGQGFDFCATRTAGSVTSSDMPPPTQGLWFLRFTPSSCRSCRPENPSDAQIYTWPGGAFSFDVASGLYFDVVDLGAKASSGSLRIYGTGETCEGNVLMSDVPLAALAIERSWSTRCIPLGPGNQKAIGLAVTAGEYDIGIDAIRFGPRCK